MNRNGGGLGRGRQADVSDAFDRRHHVRPRRRRRRRRQQAQEQQRRRDEASPCPSSSSSATTASASRRRPSSPSSHRRSTSDEGRRRASHVRDDGDGGSAAGLGPRDSAARRRNRRHHVRSQLNRRLHGKITSSRLSVHHDVQSGAAGGDDDGGISRCDLGGRRSPADRHLGDACAALRCSANVVLLAHGNRSLHVLVIQRSQTRYFHADHVSTAATVVRYKL